MKKSLAILALSALIISCDKPAETKEFKTAFVDTSKMMEEYTESKDLEAKYKSKSEEMGKELEAEMRRFEQERNAFVQKAQQLGQIWAQQNQEPLVRKGQQLQMAQDQLLRQIQQESGKEMDSLVTKVKKFVKEYGKEKGYDYVFGTGEAVSILYAKDQYDITKEVTKALNDKYTSEGKKETAPDAAKTGTATQTAPATKK